MTCPEGPDGLGAYVLGALDRDERARVEEHVRGCPACAAELAGLGGLPALLDRVRPDDLRPVAVAPSGDLFDRLSAAAAPPPAHRARRWLLVAAAALAVLAGAAGVATWPGSPATGPGSPADGPGERVVTATAGAVRATITAGDRDDGSTLLVTVAGMRPGEQCRLVAVDTDGNRHPAGVWPASAQGDGTWRGWADVPRADLASVVLLGEGGRELVRLPL